MQPQQVLVAGAAGVLWSSHTRSTCKFNSRLHYLALATPLLPFLQLPYIIEQGSIFQHKKEMESVAANYKMTYIQFLLRRTSVSCCGEKNNWVGTHDFRGSAATPTCNWSLLVAISCGISHFNHWLKGNLFLHFLCHGVKSRKAEYL